MENHSVSTNVSLEDYFAPFRTNIIGVDHCIQTTRREKVRLLYSDWTASGRAYHPIEQRLVEDVLPFIANTHTETNYTGSFITNAYLEARRTIRSHVHASENDILISYGSGMSDVLNKFQRMMGFRGARNEVKESERPVVFITHMEHHSNHTSWLETDCEVVVVPPDEKGMVSVEQFESHILRYRDRPKIASVTACSNVTGIQTPYHEIAALLHVHDGHCLVDFACSAPYVEMDMHPDSEGYLDAIFFSPHKFLGGSGASGILLFNRNLYRSEVPDVSGGGTVDWTNPWGGRKYVKDPEEREDGGTPAILQTIRAAYAIELKEEMGVQNILNREEELMDILWTEFSGSDRIMILDGRIRKRLGIISFCIEGMHYNSVVQLLNDQYGIQVRGGCSCAGTYGHYLLGIGPEESKRITDLIDAGDTTQKPGWVRLSIHPTMTDDEVWFLARAILEVAKGFTS